MPHVTELFCLLRNAGIRPLISLISLQETLDIGTDDILLGLRDTGELKADAVQFVGHGGLAEPDDPLRLDPEASAVLQDEVKVDLGRGVLRKRGRRDETDTANADVDEAPGLRTLPAPDL